MSNQVLVLAWLCYSQLKKITSQIQLSLFFFENVIVQPFIYFHYQHSQNFLIWVGQWASKSREMILKTWKNCYDSLEKLFWINRKNHFGKLGENKLFRIYRKFSSSSKHGKHILEYVEYAGKIILKTRKNNLKNLVKNFSRKISVKCWKSNFEYTGKIISKTRKNHFEKQEKY